MEESMEYVINNAEEIQGFPSFYGGYHRCSLDQPVHMEYVSDSYCDMLGYTREEIHDLFKDKLVEMVHPDDRSLFVDFVKSLIMKEQTLTLQYRMVRKGGEIIYVSETQTSQRMANGRLYGFGVTADISGAVALTAGNAENIKLPYGIMKCTCEKYPKVIWSNSYMDEIVGVNENSGEWEDFARDNIFFMIAYNERDLMREYLNEARESGMPVSIEHDIVRSDGKYVNVMGWLTSDKDEDGSSYYTFIYMRTSDRYRERLRRKENSYFTALKSAYNVIFEINLTKQTVECIHGRDSSPIGTSYEIRMAIDGAKDYWLNNYIIPEDRDMARDYFNRITEPGNIEREGRPLQMEFGIILRDGTLLDYLGVAVELDPSTVLFCCRDISNVKYVDRFAMQRGPEESEETPETGQSEQSMQLERSGYLKQSGQSMQLEQSDHSERYRRLKRPKRVFIRTFGYFDVFIGEDPIRFGSLKEKELMAILVDRNGGNVTGGSAISMLWEDEPDDERVKARYRKLAMGLKRTLEQNGIGDILVNVRSVRHLNTKLVTCDYYEFLEGNKKYRELFSGVYMQNYSWAEETLGLLLQMA